MFGTFEISNKPSFSVFEVTKWFLYDLIGFFSFEVEISTNFAQVNPRK